MTESTRRVNRWTPTRKAAVVLDLLRTPFEKSYSFLISSLAILPSLAPGGFATHDDPRSAPPLVDLTRLPSLLCSASILAGPPFKSNVVSLSRYQKTE